MAIPIRGRQRWGCSGGTLEENGRQDYPGQELQGILERIRSRPMA